MRHVVTSLVLLVGCMSAAAFADTPERVHEFMVQWDLDHDGKISWTEFEKQAAEAIPRKYKVAFPPKLIRDTFNAYDLDGDGFITEPEMQETNRRANAEASADRKN